MNRYQILDMLRKSGEVPVSGEAISRALGVSRTAVWKAVEALREEGYAITAGRNKGYLLAAGPFADIINSYEVESKLAYREYPWKVRIYESLASTNDKARELGEEPGNDRTVVLALSQTGAKGKRGGSFYAPKGTGLYLSLLFTGSRPVREAGENGRKIASACVRVLSRFSGKPCELVDGNVFCDGKKLCGILAEAVLELEADLVRNVVYGIGVHVNEASFPVSYAGTSVSLRQLAGKQFLRSRVAAELLDEIGRAVQ